MTSPPIRSRLATCRNAVAAIDLDQTFAPGEPAIIVGGILALDMTLAIDLPHVLLVRVEARAQERGMAPAEYVAKLIEEALPAEPNARAVSLLKAWEAEDATEDPAELEARRADWEATKDHLNEGHSSERKLFP